jgi:hypothetical protein
MRWLPRAWRAGGLLRSAFLIQSKTQPRIEISSWGLALKGGGLATDGGLFYSELQGFASGLPALSKPPVKCMVQNETRGFSFRKNSKRWHGYKNLGWFYCIPWFIFRLMMMMSPTDSLYTNSSSHGSATYSQIH